MERGGSIPEKETKGITRRDFLAGAGVAAVAVGLGDMFIVTGPLEREERKIAKQFPNLHDRAIEEARKKVEAEEKDAQKEGRDPDEGKVRYSKGIVEDAKKRDEKLADIRTIPSGVRKVIDYSILGVGVLALLPKGLRYYYENTKRDF